MTPRAPVQGPPGRDTQLHALPTPALGGTVDPRPRPQPPLGELPLGPLELLDDLVTLRQPPREPLGLRQYLGDKPMRSMILVKAELTPELREQEERLRAQVREEQAVMW